MGTEWNYENQLAEADNFFGKKLLTAETDLCIMVFAV